ncbi:MAG: helix-turn-helix domain-containing protein [Rectinema subterraneum]
MTFITVKQASELLGFSEKYIRKLVFLKKIPYFKPLGGKILFDQEELERLVRASRVASNEDLAEKADALLNSGGRR